MSDYETKAELVAQPHAFNTVKKLIAERHVHAFMLSGELDNGPMIAAEYIAAKVLSGENAEARVARRVHPDLIWIKPEGSELMIDQIRTEVIDNANKKPFEADAQVIVIESADTLSFDNKASANSLLKILEEPPGDVVFVLLATRSAKVLPTIRSRVIEIPFAPVADENLLAAFTNEGITTDVIAAATGLEASIAVRLARGNTGRMRELLAPDGAVLKRRAATLNALSSVLQNRSAPSELTNVIINRADSLATEVTEQLTAEAETQMQDMADAERRAFQRDSEARIKRRARYVRTTEIIHCLDELSYFWRDLLAVANNSSALMINQDYSDTLTQLANNGSATLAVNALDAIDEAHTKLRLTNVEAAVTLGALSSELAGLAGGRVRARRTLGSPARAQMGYDLALG